MRPPSSLWSIIDMEGWHGRYVPPSVTSRMIQKDSYKNHTSMLKNFLITLLIKYLKDSVRILKQEFNQLVEISKRTQNAIKNTHCLLWC